MIFFIQSFFLILIIEPEVVSIDISMTFDLEFQEDLNDPESDLHTETSEMSTAALQQVLATTTAELQDEAAVVWTFTEGSVVATALDVPVTNVQNAEEVTEQLENFDVSTVPNLQSLAVTPTGKIYIRLLRLKIGYNVVI